MTKVSARLTSKSQLVLPQAVRRLLDVGPGDSVVFNYGADGVSIEKAITQDDPFTTFDEWSSTNDDEAYRDL